MKNLTFDTLRDRYPDFYFTAVSSSWLNKNTLQLRFHYTIPPEWEFTPEIRITFGEKVDIQDVNLDIFIRAIGMIELISYWKATCSPDVYIAPQKLLPEEITFWKTLFYHGLGEFFYRNNITISEEDFMNLHVSTIKKNSPESYAFDENRVLVPVGGGKDSAVTLYLLKKHGFNVIPFVINPSQTTRNVLNAAGFKDNECVFVRREIDRRLIVMNERGFLNGHIPFSAVLAFYSVMIAAMIRTRHIALSNESSANESTIPGTPINHQYSKTFHFEKLFRDYVHRFISPTTNYFSFLRPLNELQIAALFAQMPEFHAVFRSCNAGSKQGIWCNNCPKCLFTHIILSPFLPPQYIRDVIGLRTFENESLKEDLMKVTGRTDEKPFECVGTMAEVNASLAYTLQYHYNKEPLPILLETARTFIDQTKANDFESLLKQFNPEHFLNDRFENILRHELEQLFIH